ncbi:MAG: bluetail domain-containing putative surface protein, partial [Cyanobacteriota bacterium]|nr:bluetail domain-containing putative surface protein [Cyanobacteriota bacterium]
SSPWNSGAGDASSDWRMLAAETLDGINTILWRYNPTNALHLWTLDANWGWQASGGLIPLGTEEAWTLEERFQLDADGDQRVGAPFTTLDVSGNTLLLRRGDGQAVVEVAGQRQPVASPWNSGAGDDASAWTMLAAETLDGVNTILWRYSPTNALHLWTLDANWGWQASGGLIPLGTEEAWTLEERFQLDADGDGRLGTPPPVVTLSVSPSAVLEDGTEALSYTVTRSGSTRDALSVNILLGGTATPFIDYSGITATGAIGAVAFAPGSASATLRITPTADADIEPNESIALSLAPGSGYIVGTGTAVIGNILDDDGRISLYSDTETGELPSDQGWLAFGTGFTGMQRRTSSGTLLDSTLLMADIAGYSNHRAEDAVLVNNAFPELDRSMGFSLDLRLRLNTETHFSDDRAGFSLLLLDQGPTPVGIELGFWPTKIFSQAGGDPPFAAIAGQVNGVNTSVMTSYSLRILDNHYMLLANDRLVLQGELQDYSQATVPPIFPYNPYTTPNMLFLGDNTSRASAQVTLRDVSLSMPLSGGAGRDTMTGTAGADQLNGRAGDDVIRGEAGDDWLIGGPGADELLGGSENDILNGGAGGDLLTGGPGQDVFSCPSFSDSLLAAPDVITDYSTDDVLDRPGAGTILTSSLGEVSQLSANVVASLLTATTFPANSTRAFTVNGITGTILAFDSGSAGFDAATDSLVVLEGYRISATHPVTLV